MQYAANADDATVVHGFIHFRGKAGEVHNFKANLLNLTEDLLMDYARISRWPYTINDFMIYSLDLMDRL